MFCTTLIEGLNPGFLKIRQGHVHQSKGFFFLMLPPAATEPNRAAFVNLYLSTGNTFYKECAEVFALIVGVSDKGEVLGLEPDEEKQTLDRLKRLAESLLPT
jgi:hypothetical protein